MLPEKKIKKEINENKMTYVGFCRENYTNVVDKKNLHIFDCFFEKGLNCFFFTLIFFFYLNWVVNIEFNIFNKLIESKLF